MAWYSFATYKMPWLYPYAGPASTPWFTPFSSVPVVVVYTAFGQESTGTVATTDLSSYTFGMEFTVSRAATMNAVWWYSASGALALPGTIALYAVAGTVLVHSETPTWSGSAGSGWVRAPFASPPSLSSGVSYKTCVFLDNTGAVKWYSGTADFWDTGPGSGGITNGPLTALSASEAAGDGGQDTFTSATSLSYPASQFNATNYWVDVEVQ